MMNYNHYRSKNGLPPRTNRAIGHLTYLAIHTSITILAYIIWGVQMFGEPWFYIIHLLAFYSVKPVLLTARVWVY